jgi:hypothetical protein
MKTSAWICLLAAVGFWITVAAKGLHMEPLWVAVSAVLLAVAGLGLVVTLMPQTGRD